MSKRIKLTDFTPDDKNFNEHSQYGMSLLEKSVEKVGIIESITVSADDKVISGNARQEVISQKFANEDAIVIETDGTKPIVIKRTDIKSDTKQFYEAALFANTVSKHNVKLDLDKIQEVAVDEFDINVEELGVELLESISEEDGEDEYSDNIDDPLFIQGDLIEFNNHRLLVGNSCDPLYIDKLMNGSKADLIFTDPPYDLEDTYSNLILASAKEDCHVFIMNSDKLLIQNIKNNEEHFRKMFYVDFRQARLVSNKQPMTRVDPVAEFLKGKGKFKNLKDGFSTLIECCKIHNNNKEQNHGFNQAKKVELPETFILHYSNPNELVADFFGGAGSTLIAAEKNNRNCYMMEFSEDNATIIVNRWIDYMKKHNKLFSIKINGVERQDLFNK